MNFQLPNYPCSKDGAATVGVIKVMVTVRGTRVGVLLEYAEKVLVVLVVLSDGCTQHSDSTVHNN